MTAIPPGARPQYERNGFFLTPPLLPADLIADAIERMDAVKDGHYETGIEPQGRSLAPGETLDKLCKIDQAHRCDNTIRQLLTHPAIGQWAAALTGAEMVQIWASQLLIKPPGGDSGHVGWHQDRQYWSYWQKDSQLFTAWIALSEVDADSGPMCHVRGSHRWGFLDQGNFFGQDQAALKEGIDVPEGEEWDEVPALLPAGAVSFHDRFTYHGSHANRSNRPRRSFAMHLRTERAQPRPDADAYYIQHLDDEAHAPVIYRA
ncbi:MAG: hypothetical protein GKR89_33035 [Candidatus Latescibacteria bacterium]|nr:hypothetical protein [Candidatus Latescibacterota bacterium]